MIGNPGVTLMIRLHGPAFAVDQAEPRAVFDLQPAFDIGSVAVFVFLRAFEIHIPADAHLAVKTE
ncbi:hypothetical protein D3C76_1631860 [compost metagenome]